jgi:hypothetical protein
MTAAHASLCRAFALRPAAGLPEISLLATNLSQSVIDTAQILQSDRRIMI